MTFYTFSPSFTGRLLLLFLLCIVLSFTANAQVFRLGIRSGVSFANFTRHNNSAPSLSANGVTGMPVSAISPVTSSPIQLPVIRPEEEERYYYQTDFIDDMRTGFYGGLFAEIVFDRHWSLETGISYAQKGISLRYATSFTNAANDAEGRYVFNRVIQNDYIVLPVAVKFSFSKQSRFYLVAGFYEALAVRSRIVDGTSGVYARSGGLDFEAATSTLGELKTCVIDFGVSGGGGVQWPLTSRLWAGVDVRANVGLVSLCGEVSDGGYGGFDGGARNLGIESGLRVMYKLSKQDY